MEEPVRVERSYSVYEQMKNPRVLARYWSMKSKEVTGRTELHGSSPTDIFIGRFGYPKVSIGPLIPPDFGDTSIMAAPERWHGLSIGEVFGIRGSLVRGMHTTKVGNVEGGRVEEQVRELALAEKPATADISFQRCIRQASGRRILDDISPFGPSGLIREFGLHNTKSERRVGRAYADTAMNASDAIFELYNRGVTVSKIQMGLSAGLFGIGRKRKFVPTRWSITAVDDTISKRNLKEVKGFSVIDGIKAHLHVALDNKWLVLLFPTEWEYESIEAFYPHTTWNQTNTISLGGSYEPYAGRKGYAEIGGCYYSGRLAVSERLRMMGRQASALILREVHEGYRAPVGVWNVREYVRDTLATDPIELPDANSVFKMIDREFTVGRSDWIKSSRILSKLMFQKRLA